MDENNELPDGAQIIDSGYALNEPVFVWDRALSYEEQLLVTRWFEHAYDIDLGGDEMEARIQKKENK